MNSLLDINDKIKPIELSNILEDQQVLVIDDFYKNLDWLDNPNTMTFNKLERTEQIHFINKSDRQMLLSQVSTLFPKTFYPSDSGWIRSNILSETEIPMAVGLHSDNPYIVLSVCLSDPPNVDEENDFGTTFYRHKYFGFKKVYDLKNSELFLKIFNAHRNNNDMWEPWFKSGFKKNRAIIYDGSLLHKMPWPVFGTDLKTSRLLQIFNFRIGKDQRLYER